MLQSISLQIILCRNGIGHRLHPCLFLFGHKPSYNVDHGIVTIASGVCPRLNTWVSCIFVSPLLHHATWLFAPVLQIHTFSSHSIASKSLLLLRPEATSTPSVLKLLNNISETSTLIQPIHPSHSIMQVLFRILYEPLSLLMPFDATEVMSLVCTPLPGISPFTGFTTLQIPLQWLHFFPGTCRPSPKSCNFLGSTTTKYRRKMNFLFIPMTSGPTTSESLSLQHIITQPVKIRAVDVSLPSIKHA